MNKLENNSLLFKKFLNLKLFSVFVQLAIFSGSNRRLIHCCVEEELLAPNPELPKIATADSWACKKVCLGFAITFAHQLIAILNTSVPIMIKTADQLIKMSSNFA